jgi:alpha-mannosidase
MSSAWDVNDFHLQKQTHLNFDTLRIKSEGPLRATLAASLKFGQTNMEVEVSGLWKASSSF